MINRASRRIPAIALAGLLTFGCTELQVVERSMDFNEALETSVNKTLLLNTVRASKRYPMHFSRVGQLTAQPSVDANLAFDIPFGGDATNLYTAKPSLGLAHTDNIIITALDDQDFYHGILRPIGFNIIHQYAEQGWPAPILLFLFIEQFELSPELTTTLLGGALASCRPAWSNLKCKSLEVAIRHLLELKRSDGQFACGRIQEFSSMPASGARPYEYADNLRAACFEEKQAFTRFENEPEEPDKLLAFQVITAALWVLEVDTKRNKPDWWYTETKVTITKEFDAMQGALTSDGEPPLGTSIKAKKQTEESASESETLAVVFDLPDPAGLLSLLTSDQVVNFETVCPGIGQSQDRRITCEVVFRELATESGEKEFVRTALRSPHGMLFYLGEIVYEQTVEKRDTLSWLFKVETGLAEDAAVSVQHEGTAYNIPAGSDGKRPKHSSMQVLALIYQILNLHKKGSNLPFVPTVISAGG